MLFCKVSIQIKINCFLILFPYFNKTFHSTISVCFLGNSLEYLATDLMLSIKIILFLVWYLTGIAGLDSKNICIYRVSNCKQTNTVCNSVILSDKCKIAIVCWRHLEINQTTSPRTAVDRKPQVRTPSPEFVSDLIHVFNPVKLIKAQNDIGNNSIINYNRHGIFEFSESISHTLFYT